MSLTFLSSSKKLASRTLSVPEGTCDYESCQTSLSQISPISSECLYVLAIVTLVSLSSGRDASIPSRYGKYKKGFQEAEEAARQGGAQPGKEKKGGPAWIPGKANPR